MVEAVGGWLDGSVACSVADSVDGSPGIMVTGTWLVDSTIRGGWEDDSEEMELSVVTGTSVCEIPTEEEPDGESVAKSPSSGWDVLDAISLG